MIEIEENIVNWEQMLWRYFSTERFLETIENSNIYFASAKEFEDHFEGSIAIISNKYEEDPRFSKMSHLENAFFELKMLSKISCWHMADYESDAMWKLYSMNRKGVSIITTPQMLKKCVDPLSYRTKIVMDEKNSNV